ncbi:hypothetical protein Tco_0491068 [Tanacetum coccineum]
MRLLGRRVDVRTYLLGGAIDGSEANGIIRNPKLELESSRFTFDLVPLSYESVDVVVGKNWLLRHKAELVCHEKVVKMPWSCKVRVGSNGNLLWEASVLLGGVRVAREDDRGVTEGREDVREVFQQRRSGAKRKLSRCGRNQMGNEPILALPEGADDFVVYYDARSKDLEACLEKGRRIEHEAKVMDGCISELILMASTIWEQLVAGSKYLAYLEVEVEYQGSSGLLLQPELPVVEVDRLIKDIVCQVTKCEWWYDAIECSQWTDYVTPFLVCLRTMLMPRVVKSRDEIFSRWGYCDNRGLSRLHNQSIERDRLIGIGFVLDFVEFISFTFGDKEMILVIEAVSR